MTTTTQTIEATENSDKAVIVTFTSTPTNKEAEEAFDNGADVLEF